MTEQYTQPVTESSISFDETYARFYPEIVGFLRRHGAGDSAEDIAQDTFAKVFKRLGSYEGRSSLKTWLTACALHTQSDRHRSDKRRPLDFTDDSSMLEQAAPDYEADPATIVVQNHSRDELLANITSVLTPDQARAISLTIDGYGGPEISEILGIPPVTVRSLIHRGRKVLKAAGILPLE